MNDLEQHGRDFLDFVAKNEKRLKKNLRKNITYDEDLFEDAYQNTILKVYDKIMSGTYIDDFENYFFIASKWEFIGQQTKYRRKLQEEDSNILFDIAHGLETNGCGLTEDGQRIISKITEEDDEWKEKEERNNNILTLFSYISKRLNEHFSPAECDIFLIYYRLKSEKKGISYKKMANITGRTFKEISTIIQKIKKFIQNDDEIQNIKQKLV